MVSRNRNPEIPLTTPIGDPNFPKPRRKVDRRSRSVKEEKRRFLDQIQQLNPAELEIALVIWALARRTFPVCRPCILAQANRGKKFNISRRQQPVPAIRPIHALYVGSSESDGLNRSRKDCATRPAATSAPWSFRTFITDTTSCAFWGGWTGRVSARRRTSASSPNPLAPDARPLTAESWIGRWRKPSRQSLLSTRCRPRWCLARRHGRPRGPKIAVGHE